MAGMSGGRRGPRGRRVAPPRRRCPRRRERDVLPNPYVGPRPFETGEQLYGRDRETRELLDLLIAERIVLLHSPSGAGKTSLVQAALIPRLRDEGFTSCRLMRVSTAPPPGVAGATNRYVLSLLLSLEEGLPPAQQLPLEELQGVDLGAYLDRRAALEARPRRPPARTTAPPRC